jgi:hypothetical protein
MVADPTKQPAPNLLNCEFSADSPNRKWVSDITIVPANEGDLYLAATMDLWSKMILRLCSGRVGPSVKRWKRPWCNKPSTWLCNTAGPTQACFITPIEGRNTLPTAFAPSYANTMPLKATAAKAMSGTTRPWSLSSRRSKWSCFVANASEQKLKPFRRCLSTSKSSTIVNAFTQRWLAAALPSLKSQAETNLSVHSFGTGHVACHHRQPPDIGSSETRLRVPPLSLALRVQARRCSCHTR